MNVIVKPHPLIAQGVRSVTMPHGLSLAEMVDLCALDPVLRPMAVAVVAGEVVPPDRWRHVRPKAQTHVLITVRAGKGGSGKNPLATVLSIAVIAAASFAAPYLAFQAAQLAGAGWATASLGFIASSSFLSVATPLIAGGLTMVGALAVNALIPPGTQSVSTTYSGSTADAASVSITGQSNQSNPYGVVPRLFGRMRMAPLYAAEPYTQLEGEDQYLYLLFDFGLGPVALDNLRIGESLLSTYDGVETVVHQRWTDGDALSLYRYDNHTQSFAIEITAEDGPQVVESADHADEIVVDLTFSGLVSYDDSGNRQKRTVDMRCEYRTAGSDDAWTIAPDYDNGDDQTGLEVVEIADGALSQTYVTGALTTGTVTLTLAVPSSYRGSSPIYGLKYSVECRAEGDADWVRLYQSDGYDMVNTSAGAGTSAVFTHTLTATRGKRMEIRLTRLYQAVWGSTFIPANAGGVGALPTPTVVYASPSDSFAFQGSTSSAVLRCMTIRPAVSGKYEVRVTRITADTTSSQILDTVTLTGLRSISFDPPIAFAEAHTLLEMRIMATDQLNGVVSEFSAIATAILPVWNGSAWAEQETRNPAWAYAEVLRGSGNTRPRPDSRLDLAGLLDWAQACDAAAPQSGLPDAVNGDAGDPMWTCDMVINTASTVGDVLTNIAASGRATRGMPDGRHGVVRDVAQTVPVQVFTPRNSWGFRGKKTFVDQAHALRCTYIDPDLDWEQGDVMVYADGYDASTASRVEKLDVVGCTRQAQAWREGRYQLAVARLRPETYELNADIENLVCTRGDLVEVAHDVPMIGGTPVRVRGLSTAEDGSITALWLDEVVSMLASGSFTLRHRNKAGVLSWYPVQAQTMETQTVELVSPAAAGSITVGDLMVFGSTGEVTAEMIVREIVPAENLTAKLILIDAAPEVHTADQSEIPAYDPHISQAPVVTPDPVTDLTATVTWAIEGGAYVYGIRLSWAGWGAAYEVYRQVSGRWVLQDTVSAPTFTFADLARGETVIYAVLAVSRTGRKLALSQASRGSQTALVAGLVPTDVTDFNCTILGERASLSWTVDATTVAAWWRIRWSPLTDGASWASAVDLVARVAYPGTTVEVAALSGTYLIKGVDLYGQESAVAARVVTTIPGLTGNVVLTVDEGPAFGGAMTSVYLADDGLRLTSAQMVDDWPDWDGVEAVDVGASGLAAVGLYAFAEPVDLGQVYACRITASISVSGVDVAEGMDVWGSVDARPSWDGVDPADYGVTLQMSTTEDDPASDTASWSAWSSFTAGDYRARGVRLRAVLASWRSGISPVVSALSVTLDMPDTVQGENDLTCPAGGVDVVFPQAFFALGALAVTGDALSSGDRSEITGRSGTGFHVEFFDAAGTSVSRQFDYLAKGY